MAQRFRKRADGTWAVSKPRVKHRVGARRQRKPTRCRKCGKDRYLNEDKLCTDCEDKT